MLLLIWISDKSDLHNVFHHFCATFFFPQNAAVLRFTYYNVLVIVQM